MIKELYLFYDLRLPEFPFYIIYDDIFDIAVIQSWGNWKMGKFHYEKVEMKIDTEKSNGILKLENLFSDTIGDSVLHEFIHFLQIYYYGFIPQNQHNRIFYDLGNKFDPKFEEREFKFNGTKMKEEAEKEKERKLEKFLMEYPSYVDLLRQYDEDSPLDEWTALNKKIESIGKEARLEFAIANGDSSLLYTVHISFTHLLLGRSQSPESILITTISPTDFLKLAIPIVKYNTESLAWIEETMMSMRVLPAPFLIVSTEKKSLPGYEGTWARVIAHEGRHRAFIAKRLGVKEIPVAFEFRYHNLYPIKNDPKQVNYQITKRIVKNKPNWYEFIGDVQTSNMINFPNFIRRLSDSEIEIDIASQSIDKSYPHTIKAKISNFELNFDKAHELSIDFIKTFSNLN
jgi:hypothetical protein